MQRFDLTCTFIFGKILPVFGKIPLSDDIGRNVDTLPRLPRASSGSGAVAEPDNSHVRTGLVSEPTQVAVISRPSSSRPRRSSIRAASLSGAS